MYITGTPFRLSVEETATTTTTRQPHLSHCGTVLLHLDRHTNEQTHTHTQGNRLAETMAISVVNGLNLFAVVVGGLNLVRPAQSFLAPSLTTSRPRQSLLRMARQKYNPFSTMFGDMAASLVGGNKGSSNPAVDASLASMGLPWEDVSSLLHSKQTANERKFRDDLDMGYGPASPLHKLRLYDKSNKEDDVRVVFYRDSASWCPYCQKVWITLEEKRIPYRIEKVSMRCYGDKPPSFMAMQPSGQIPVAKIDGRVYGQSNDIIYAVEQLFPQHKSLSPPKGKEMEAQQLLRLERTIFSAWMYWLTGSRDPERYRQEFIGTLNDVEDALKAMGGPFFMGKQMTMVDIQFAPFLERMAASLLYFKGFQMRVPPGTKTDFPNLNKWFDAMEKHESYTLTKSDYYTHCWDLPPQLGGCTYEQTGEIFEKAINGERSVDGTQGSWELPLQPHNGGIEPDWTWVGDEAAAKREAAERLTANHDAITRFAARGAGKKGIPAYSAPLADPNAVPNDAMVVAVEAALRVVSMALLDGTKKHESTMKEMAATMRDGGGKDFVDGVVASLAYLRDRVGVPRDMRLPAARQLRAHLNWAIGFLLEEA